VLPDLAKSFRVLVYDRRGHSRSERPSTQGSVAEDGDDLAALLEALDMAPAHVVTSSFGGNIALGLAARRPEVFRSLTCHEPPLWSLLADDPEAQEVLAEGAQSLEGVTSKIAAGDHEAAARQFADEVAFGPGAWENALIPEARAIMVGNAPTFLDEAQDPGSLVADKDGLASLDLAVHLTDGSESPPTFPRVLDRLVELIPNATRERIEGAGHVPHQTNPEQYVEVVTRALTRVQA
jgi:pimeloyl-ACP methyl ester carboxylesterase